MSDIAIRVEGLSKQYRIGKRERYKTLRDTLADMAAAPARWLRSSAQPALASDADGASDFIWALKDVSFEVPRGAVLGVIGRNGAGKSTLLKILSRITEPTEGRVEIHGRVGSLLEVGTGFHPELTGRENILLNGAILGMRRAEILRKFDEIVAFAEVEKFIDTPVKHYSSGMYMRLAFAVAAHLEPEILLVDEVLAVGDAQFQKKCLGKMGEVARQGRTVLFVSHNLVAVGNLCASTILLHRGFLDATDVTAAVVNRYLHSVEREITGGDLSAIHRGMGSGDLRFKSLSVIATQNNSEVVRAGDPFRIRLEFSCARRVRKPVFSLAIYSINGACLFALRTTDTGFGIAQLSQSGSVELDVQNPNLLSGRYLLHCAAGDEQDPYRHDHIMEAAFLDIHAADVYRSGRIDGEGWSNLFFDCSWRLTPLVHS